MPSKTTVISGFVFLVLTLLVVKVFYGTPTLNVLRDINDTPDSRSFYAPSEILIEQRNNLSQLLNLKQKKIGQLECEKVAHLREATSETGGWCQKSSKENSGHHMTDQKLVPPLIEYLKGKYIGSFGDGPGRYKQLFLDSGKVKGYDAYDGAPFCETTSEGRVQFLDLTLPQYGLPLYDWIISLEVAEHIPKKFESIYIDNIVRHAREGVVLSWARPGQGGYSHVNNRPFEYVKDLMNRHGFLHDDVQSQLLRNTASFSWFKRNTNVYRRKSVPSVESMKPFT